MSHVIDFYAGDAKTLCAAFDAQNFRLLEKSALAHADFSINIALGDIDDLSRAALAFAGQPPRTLFKKGLYAFVGTKAEAGAYTLDRSWVLSVAAISPKQAKALAAKWAEVSDTGLEVTADVVAAVKDLLVLCHKASSESGEVVFTWSL